MGHVGEVRERVIGGDMKREGFNATQRETNQIWGFISNLNTNFFFKFDRSFMNM